MRNLLFAFLLPFLFASCEKKDSIPRDEEGVDTQLAISDVIFATNSILEKKQTLGYITLRYWKLEQIANTDDVSLVVNGVNAKKIKQTPHEEFSGSNVLFELPAINNVGEVKASYTIKSGNKSYFGEKILRYVGDYNIATVWEKLDKDFILRNPHRTYLYEDGTFSVAGAMVLPEPSILGLGVYGNIRSVALKHLNPSFIPGLNGVYRCSYDALRNLSFIEIYLGDELVDASFDKAATIADITKVYGPPTTNSRGRKVYSSGSFDIEVDVNSPKPTATIRKVRI